MRPAKGEEVEIRRRRDAEAGSGTSDDGGAQAAKGANEGDEVVKALQADAIQATECRSLSVARLLA